MPRNRDPVWSFFECTRSKNTGLWARCKSCSKEMQGILHRMHKHIQYCKPVPASELQTSETSMMAWGMPPPPPPRPASLANLTTAELQRMEGNERRNIEARLSLLREIQAMLDASVLLMQQYSTVVANLPQTSATVSTQTEHITGPETTPIVPKTEPDVVPTASNSKPQPTPSTSKAGVSDAALPGTSLGAADTLHTNRVKTEADADAEELRKRRLQKFTMEK